MKKFLVGFSICMSFYLVGITVISYQYGPSPPPEAPRFTATPGPSPTATPEPWAEVQREPSSKLPCEAVLVRRPSPGFEGWELKDEYRLYIVPRGGKIADDSAFPATFPEYADRACSECVFAGFGIEGPSIRWKYGDQLVVETGQGESRIVFMHNMETHFQEIQGEEVFVLVEYIGK